MSSRPFGELSTRRTGPRQPDGLGTPFGLIRIPSNARRTVACLPRESILAIRCGTNLGVAPACTGKRASWNLRGRLACLESTRRDRHSTVGSICRWMRSPVPGHARSNQPACRAIRIGTLKEPMKEVALRGNRRIGNPMVLAVGKVSAARPRSSAGPKSAVPHRGRSQGGRPWTVLRRCSEQREANS